MADVVWDEEPVQSDVQWDEPEDTKGVVWDSAPAQENASIPQVLMDTFAQYGQKVGRRVSEASSELNNLPAALVKLYQSGGSDGKMEVFQGLPPIAAFKALASPIDAAGEQAASVFTQDPDKQKMVGDFTSAAATLPISMMANAGKIPAVTEAVLNAMGLVNKVGPVKTASMADQVANLRQLDGEDWAEALAKEIAFQGDLRPQARQINLDPEGMQRTSSILDAAQNTITTKPGHLDLNAGMETGRGFLERPMPTESDFFRTTQQSIEEATGGIGNRNAQELLREKQLASDRILQEAISAKEMREIKMKEYFTTGDPEALKAGISKAEVLPLEKTTAYALHGNLADEVENTVAKSRELGRVGSWIKGAFQESTRMVAEFGPAGRVLARDTVKALDQGQREGGTAVTIMQRVVRALDQSEKNNLVEVLDKGVAPASREVAYAAQEIKALFQDISRRSYASGMTIKNPMTGEVVPWTPHPGGDYFPHFLREFDKIKDDPRYMAQAVKSVKEQALKEGRVISDGEARSTLNFMIENGQKRFGKLEMARVFNFTDFDTDVERVLTRYLEGSYKRLNLVEEFGADFKRADDLVEMIGQGGNSDYAVNAAKNYIDRITGREQHSSMFVNSGQSLVNLARHAEVATKLGQAVIANLSQTALTAVVAGFKPAMAGVREAMTMGGKEFAGLTGATLDSTMFQVMEGLKPGNFSGKVLKYTGFNAVERLNRTIAANAGRHFADDLFKNLQTGMQNGSSRVPEYRRHLEKMGINVAEALGRGSLSLDDQLKAGQNIVKRTQFQTGVADLPLLATTPLGRMTYQFKSFAIKSAQMIKDDIVKEAGRGNFAPMTRALLVLPITGEIVNDVQSFVNGTSRPETALGRIADNIAAVGVFGLYYQMWKAVDQGPAAISNMLMGPVIGDAVSGIANVYQAGEAAGNRLMGEDAGSADALLRQALRNVPVVGPMVAHRVFPTREEKRRQKRG